MEENYTPHNVQEVTNHSSIHEVLLVSTDSKCFVHHSYINAPDVKLSFSKKITPDIVTIPDTKSATKKNTQPHGFITSLISMKAEGISLKDIKETEDSYIVKKSDVVFRISVTYFITYRVLNIDKLNRDAMLWFGSKNAYFNVYPFLREFILNISQKFNLPRVLLPLLKPSTQPNQNIKGSQQPAKSESKTTPETKKE